MIRANGFYARGRRFTPIQIAQIEEIVARHYVDGRTRLSERVCRALRWRQRNGRLKDMACREVLRKLDDLGVITLPPPKWGGATWCSAEPRLASGIDQTPITSLNFEEIDLVRVTSKLDLRSSLWNKLVDQYHYLHSSRIVGRQIKYIAFHNSRPVACLGWSDCAWAQKARDAWIGWSADQRSRNRDRLINNSRFLILPWVRVPNFASWIIARCSSVVISDWAQQYSTEPVLLETFVDAERFLGTCYRAANWTAVGTTAGYAKVGNSHHNSQLPKYVFVYAVTRHFRDILKGRMK
jgi:hypothetical protein